MAQSTLSEAISRLERNIGGLLFIRSTRRVELTELGSAFLQDARRSYDNLMASSERARAMAKRKTFEFSIGYTVDAPDVMHALIRVMRELETDVVPPAFWMHTPSNSTP